MGWDGGEGGGPVPPFISQVATFARQAIYFKYELGHSNFKVGPGPDADSLVRKRLSDIF